MEQKQSFLGYLHSFRGFAILNIVMIHGIVFPIMAANEFNYDKTKLLPIINEVLFHDATIYFAIISGLLFSAVLQSRGYKKFYKSKILNVFLPYLFFTFLFSIFKPPSEEGMFGIHSEFLPYLQAVGTNLIYGKAQFTYWYLPVLFGIFIVTPLLAIATDTKKWGPHSGNNHPDNTLIHIQRAGGNGLYH